MGLAEVRAEDVETSNKKRDERAEGAREVGACVVMLLLSFNPRRSGRARTRPLHSPPCCAGGAVGAQRFGSGSRITVGKAWKGILEFSRRATEWGSGSCCERVGMGSSVIEPRSAAVQWPAVKRRLFTILSALSLLLFVAVVVLWVRSYKVNDTFGWYSDHWAASGVRLSAWGVTSDSGGLALFRLRRWTTFPPYMRDMADAVPSFRGFNHIRENPVAYPYMHDYGGRAWLGFGLFKSPKASPILHALPWVPPLTDDDRFLVLPFWSAAVVAGLLPILALGRCVRGQLRRFRGGCPSCGYDMRATPGRCPECGNVPGEAAA